MKKIVISLVLLSTLFAPVIVFAQGGPGGASITSLNDLVRAVEGPIWTVFGLIALIAFVTSGILFMTAGGDAEKVKGARSAFLWGIVGVVVGILAFSIVRIIDSVV